jgi:hypothetical protein
MERTVLCASCIAPRIMMIDTITSQILSLALLMRFHKELTQ